MDLAKLTDQELLGKLEGLAEAERFCLVDFLRHLIEVDGRRACERTRYGTLFAYLTRRLGCSEPDAVRRIKAARAAAKYPSILRLLATSELHLVGVAILEPVLTSENHERLLRRASRRSTREIERLAAAVSPPEPGPKDRMRALPPLPPSAPTPSLASETETTPGPVLGLELSLLPEPAPQTTPPEHRVAFTFTAGEEVRSWFEQARDLLRHRFPMGRMEEIFGEALRRLVKRERPASSWRRRASTQNASSTRSIPKWVQDEVWRRDGGRCAYEAADGGRCGQTAWLEFDHIVPYALGGRSDDPSGVRLLCRAHNGAEARRVFGDDAVAAKRHSPRRSGAA